LTVEYFTSGMAQEDILKLVTTGLMNK